MKYLTYKEKICIFLLRKLVPMILKIGNYHSLAFGLKHNKDLSFSFLDGKRNISMECDSGDCEIQEFYRWGNKK